MGACDLCNRSLSFFATKVRVKYNYGHRTVCARCFDDLERTDTGLTESTCSAKRWCIFSAIFVPILLIYIIGMVAINVTQCAKTTTTTRDHGVRDLKTFLQTNLANTNQQSFINVL